MSWEFLLANKMTSNFFGKKCQLLNCSTRLATFQEIAYIYFFFSRSQHLWKFETFLLYRFQSAWSWKHILSWYCSKKNVFFIFWFIYINHRNNKENIHSNVLSTDMLARETANWTFWINISTKSPIVIVARVSFYLSGKFVQLFVKVRDLPLLVTQGHNNGVNTERREGRERDKERERCFVNNNFSIHSHTLFRCHVIHTHTHLVRAYTYINPCTHTHTFLIRWNVY